MSKSGPGVPLRSSQELITSAQPSVYVRVDRLEHLGASFVALLTQSRTEQATGDDGVLFTIIRDVLVVEHPGGVRPLHVWGGSSMTTGQWQGTYLSESC